MKMKVISVVSVIFLTACVVCGNPLGQLKESRDAYDNLFRQDRAVSDDYEPVGCFSVSKLRKLKIFGKKAYKKSKATSGTPFDQCVQGVGENDYEIIGIQKIRRNIICRQGNEDQWKPDADIDKLKPSKCKNDVGSRYSIFVYRKSLNSSTCSANSKTYNHGEKIVFHNVTYPIEDALCTSCLCNAGSVTGCLSYYCDIGLGGTPVEVCDHWTTGQEGVCCPRCECSNNGDTWVKRLSSGDCYECSCEGSSVRCSSKILCATGCPGTTVAVPGKCCPKCIPTPAPPTTGPVFTIQLTTSRSPPTFPFPFPKTLDEISRDEQLNGEEYDKTEQ